MQIATTQADNGREINIKISGRFTFALHGEFRQAYAGMMPNARYVLDMAQVSYVDSSALGMLLILREHAGGEASRIEIANASPAVKKILTIANFDRFFSIC